MAKKIEQLTALEVARLNERGTYRDGGGLCLYVTGPSAKSWVYRYTLNGRAREMGLGSLNGVSLAEARTRASECRCLCSAGIDPIEARKAERQRARIEAAKAITFKDAAERYIAAHEAGWRNAKSALQWRNTIATYAEPIIGKLPVQAVDVGLVVKVLEPIWATKPETAGRLRGRIESVLDWATVRGYRTGENPARWRGHLQNLLPNPARVRKVRHHAALPYTEIGAFMRSLRAQEGIAVVALQFLILTATRTSETIGAKWSEIDLANAVWIIPADRMKAAREFRVPLSAPTIAILNRMRKIHDRQLVFPGRFGDHPLSNMACLQLLKRMGRGDLTAHGFRSTFRDWAAERTNYPREVAEMALAHAVSDHVEAAYRRGDLFDKRRRLMEAWARYCGVAKPPAEVIPFRALS